MVKLKTTFILPTKSLLQTNN